MARYRVQWTETDYLTAYIDADSEWQAQEKFDRHEFAPFCEPEVTDTEFGEGPDFILEDEDA